MLPRSYGYDEFCYNEYHFHSAVCHFVEHHFAECHFVEHHTGECHYDKCSNTDNITDQEHLEYFFICYESPQIFQFQKAVFKTSPFNSKVDL